MKFLRGKKTYLVGLAMIFAAIFHPGGVNVDQLLEGLGLLSLRAGIKKGSEFRVPSSESPPPPPAP